MPLFKTKLTSEEKARKKEQERIIKEVKTFHITEASEQALNDFLNSITLEKIAEIKAIYDEEFVSLPKKLIHIAGTPGALLPIQPPDQFMPEVEGIRANCFAKAEQDIQKQIEKIKALEEELLLDYLHIEEISEVKQQSDLLCTEAPTKIAAIREKADEAIKDIEDKYSTLPYANEIGILDIRYTEISAITLREMQAYFFEVELPLRDIHSKQMKASDRRILREVKDDLVGIKRDFVADNRRITQQNRQRVQQVGGNTLINSQTTTPQESITPQNISSNPIARVEALKSLKELLDAGVLTQAEFDSEKSKILGSD